VIVLSIAIAFSALFLLFDATPPAQYSDHDLAVMMPQMNETKEQWSAVVLGPTGGTGVHLVKQLAACGACSRVTAVVRKQLSIEEMKAKFSLQDEELKKVEQQVVDYDRIEQFEDAFRNQDKAFVALGTTYKQAGSAEAFRRVDFEYVVNAAKMLKQGGTKHFSLITSAGSNKNSFFLYPRTKGEVEEACDKIGFERYSIFRPGLLLTSRTDSRPLERFLQKVYPAFHFMLSENAKATPTEQVARAMVVNAFRPPLGAKEVYNTADIRLLRVGQTQ